MSDLEVQEYLQDRQHRFEAALAFATNPTWVEGELRPQSIWKAVELADQLLADLETTRTKTEVTEDTPF